MLHKIACSIIYLPNTNVKKNVALIGNAPNSKTAKTGCSSVRVFIVIESNFTNFMTQCQVLYANLMEHRYKTDWFQAHFRPDKWRCT